MSEFLFNDLLLKRAIDPAKVIVMRHRPFERELTKVLPWLAADKPDLFNAYQQTQGEKLERTMRTLEGDGHVASFIGHESGKRCSSASTKLRLRDRFRERTIGRSRHSTN
ncbi:MAG: hypothetical protein NXH99_13160 [Rhodobacteraceae bacterium]|nr:hypothetical protein [Paracoccaceae bacterium]